MSWAFLKKDPLDQFLMKPQISLFRAQPQLKGSSGGKKHKYLQKKQEGPKSSVFFLPDLRPGRKKTLDLGPSCCIANTSAFFHPPTEGNFSHDRVILGQEFLGNF